jgi:hypothetical protein
MAMLTETTNGRVFSCPARPDSRHIVLATGLTRYELSN